ncbi:curved DNA-binding protein CbpA [Mycoplasmoides fastidiosum]|uniref:Curved DNA-binding protein CbpA n=1 Tax=Mycoplasmoides fastidiosum TaxID=92758 RepID=A0ABU0LYD1_9BACT|nr:DnaJ domain-containing protein [Mycoplasmoides fastidiosum]MDQ0513713.1 curved DNA-binding protein CbpA [Mycoplasmoides fastidiosum]UUD37864.1 DnaJ domain-containing protein [Mycoplasmoides fastidiosum]
MKKLNHYQILKVNYEATTAEIKKSYRKLLKKFHPDIYKKDDAHDITVLINQAYLILSDPVARDKYDRELFLKDDFDQNLERFFQNTQNQSWEEGKATSIFDKVYGFDSDSQQQNTTVQFRSSRFQNTKTFWNNSQADDTENIEDQLQKQHEETKSWNGYFDNAFDVKINKKAIKTFCHAFNVDWHTVLEILNESNLNRKEIYFRCYYGQHFFDHYHLNAKQILAENVYKSVIVYSDEYKKFVKRIEDQKGGLNLNAKFYFDEILLETNFEKLIRYYRLFECNFCIEDKYQKKLKYCHFCLNKRFLKERMAINIRWKQKNPPQTNTIVFKNFGNRNDYFIGDLILKLVPMKNFGEKNSQMVIYYEKENFSIDEIEENKIL